MLCTNSFSRYPVVRAATPIYCTKWHLRQFSFERTAWSIVRILKSANWMVYHSWNKIQMAWMRSNRYIHFLWDLFHKSNVPIGREIHDSVESNDVMRQHLRNFHHLQEFQFRLHYRWPWKRKIWCHRIWLLETVPSRNFRKIIHCLCSQPANHQRKKPNWNLTREISLIEISSICNDVGSSEFSLMVFFNTARVHAKLNAYFWTRLGVSLLQNEKKKTNFFQCKHSMQHLSNLPFLIYQNFHHNLITTNWFRHFGL